MNDIEKTIDILVGMADNYGKDSIQDIALSEGILALEKQTPKVITRTDITKSFLCPTCNSERYWKDGYCCKDCGQKLEWQA